MKNDKQEIRQLRQNEYEYQRSRLIKARADTMELKRDLVERSLIPVSEANQVWELMIANCYLRGALVSDCAEILSKATSIQEVHHLLQIEIYKMLHDFANMEIDYAI